MKYTCKCYFIDIIC